MEIEFASRYEPQRFTLVADVVINGTIQVRNRCSHADCPALDNFWRSLSNLTINITMVDDNCLSDQTWAASQAAPIRRLQVLGGDLNCSMPAASPDTRAAASLPLGFLRGRGQRLAATIHDSQLPPHPL